MFVQNFKKHTLKFHSANKERAAPATNQVLEIKSDIGEGKRAAPPAIFGFVQTLEVNYGKKTITYTCNIVINSV